MKLPKYHDDLQAITTRYLGPTNSRGSRVKATAAAGSVTLRWDDALSSQQNHCRAANALRTKFKWSGGCLFQGGLADGSYVWVQVIFHG